MLILAPLPAQSIIEPKEGYSPQIGVLVSMLEDLKHRVTYSVKDLNQEQTDFLLDENANRIGALILHLAATEKYYQLFTFENRGFKRKETNPWKIALELGEAAREEFKDQPISYYLNIWDEVRNQTLELLKTKEDEWLTEIIGRNSMNNYWAWYHVMEHQANHMGQIRLILKRFTGNSVRVDPTGE